MTFIGSKHDKLLELSHQLTSSDLDSSTVATEPGPSLLASLGPIEKLMNEARLNFIPSSCSNRFGSDWKKFCALTLMQAGPNYFSIIQKNAPAPSITASNEGR